MAKKQSKGQAARGRTSASGGGSSRGAARRKRAAAPRRKTAAKKAARPAGRKSARTGQRRGAAVRKTAKRTTPRAARPATKRAAPSRGRKAPSRGARPTGRQVARTTASARWIESPDEHAERPGQTLATRNHDVIRQWAEERGAQPATIPGAGESPRVLRLNFPGFGGQSLEEVDWDDWFKTFDDRNLVFLFQERLKNGNQSNFFRFDNPEREDA